MNRRLVLVRRRNTGDLRDAVRDVLEHIQPGDAVLGKKACGTALRLLEDCREYVSRVRFIALRRLDVEHRCLKRAPEGGSLLRLTVLPARPFLDRVLQVLIELSSEPPQ